MGVREVFSEADEGGNTIFLMHEVEGEMAVPMVRVVYLVPVCDLCEEGTWVGSKRVEREAVN